MLLLVTTGYPDFIRYAHPNLGRLFAPSDTSSLKKTSMLVPWAADNECFVGLNEPAYRRMLDKIEGVPGCLFVTVPDVVADSENTLRLWHEWFPVLSGKGLPAAFVIQDGVRCEEVPWDDLSCVFVGGSTVFKLSSYTARIVSEAKERGKWVHMGRVNTGRRIQYANAIGCNSVDGTGWSMFKERYLRNGLRLVSEPQQLMIGQ